MRSIIYRAGYKFQLEANFNLVTSIYPPQDAWSSYTGLATEGYLWIREGYAWDGPSGPTINTKNSLRASLVHDALYQLIRLNQLDIRFRYDIDVLFYYMLIEDGMSSLRALTWYHAVRKFGEKHAYPESDRPLLTAP